MSDFNTFGAMIPDELNWMDGRSAEEITAIQMLISCKEYLVSLTDSQSRALVAQINLTLKYLEVPFEE